jgi:hypothetical protein
VADTHASNPITDVAHATGSFMKSAGRFSLAMSLLAARQASSLATPTRRRGAVLDEVTDAAGRQLSGPVRTAFAIGTNLQSGMVDAAFDLAGLGKTGQAPQGDTAALAIPLSTGVSRRVTGVRTVASGALGRAAPQEEFVQRLNAYQDEAVSGAISREAAVVGLWKSEGLCTGVGKYLLPANSLNDPQLHREVLPIAHVGFGSGSTEAAVFDVGKLDALFADRCAPDYRDFAYEGIGAILRIYERGFFKVMSGTLGLIRLDAPDGPDPSGFFSDWLARFPTATQRLVVHGYGRLIAFSNMNIYRALSEVTTLPPDRIEAAAHGAGFAFAFMNNADLPRVLENSAVPFDPLVRSSFQNGLIYSLVFFDWYLPGLLEHWQPAGRLEAELIDHARREAAATHKRGFPLAFRLETPRT